MSSWKPPVLTLLRLLLGSLFLATGAQKILEPNPFIENVANYQLLPEPITPLAALFVLSLEVLLGVLLLVGWLSRPAGLVSALLSLGFAGFVSSALLRGLDVNCGCFSDWQVSWSHVGLNLTMAVAATAIAVWGSGSLSLASFDPGDSTKTPLIVGAGLTLLNVALLYTYGLPRVSTPPPQLFDPRLNVQFEPPSVDLGVVKQEEPTEVRATLRNLGTVTAVIDRVETTCRCTDAVAEKNEILPGDTTGFKLTYKAGANRGRIYQTVFVYFKGVEEPAALDVLGTIDSMVEVLPGVITLRSNEQKIVTLRSNRPGKTVKVEGISTPLDSLKMKLESREPSASVRAIFETSEPLPQPINGASVWPVMIMVNGGPPAQLYVRGEESK